MRGCSSLPKASRADSLGDLKSSRFLVDEYEAVTVLLKQGCNHVTGPVGTMFARPYGGDKSEELGRASIVHRFFVPWAVPIL